jgi:hypothetical protein
LRKLNVVNHLKFGLPDVVTAVMSFKGHYYPRVHRLDLRGRIWRQELHVYMFQDQSIDLVTGTVVQQEQSSLVGMPNSNLAIEIQQPLSKNGR